jgi:glycosyltransferase involved in cell wall biosynthesis
MNDQPLVSIIINNYNYGHFLTEAIDSALSQTYPHIQVIVVDDGSTDNSREIIASYRNRVLPVLKENGGQASAFNAGFAASQGDIICFLDSDDVFLPEKVTEVVNILRDYRENSWCFHPLKLVDADTKTLVKNNHQGSVYECDLRLDIKRGKLRGKLPFSIPATSGLCFRRSLLQQILPMPEAEAISLNDSYLQFTAFALGKGFALAKELSLQRVHGDNAYTFRPDKQRLVARINILTAYWIRANFPSLYRFTNKLFAEGIGTYWRTGGIEAKSQEVVKNYLSSVLPLERLKINARVLYHYLKI